MNDKKQKFVRYENNKESSKNRKSHSLRHRLGKILADSIIMNNIDW